MMGLLDSASMYAERGLHTIPVWRSADGVCSCPRGKDCISPGKHPAIDAWQTSATTDLMLIRDWFSAARYNIGVVCGPSNVVVIDIDPRNGGEATFQALIAALGDLPATPTADSGGGGTHYVFRRPGGELVSKLGDGVDLLRDARQFLVEPSIHPSGQVYRWRAGHGPDELEIAELPSAWIARIRQPARRAVTKPAPMTDERVRRARAYLAKIPGAVAGDSGHTATFNAACHVMFGFDLGEDDTLALLTHDYNPRCDPPWSERELKHKVSSAAARSKRERGYLLTDRPRIESTRAAATYAPASPAAEERDWTSRLLAKADGTARRAYHNTAMFVRYHPEFAGRWSLDQMTGAPWFDGKIMDPAHVHHIRAKADCTLGYTPPATDVEAAIVAAAQDRPFHPILQYLRSLDWDGEPRLASMARDFFGSDKPLHADMVRKFMIGAAARALWPGCKLDTALMLVGPQGCRKSTFFAVLGGQWHADSYIDITNKDGTMQLHSAWIYELSELENVVTGAKESRLKAWMSSTSDMYRAPYAKATEPKPRAVVVCGTTNRERILTDDTGSRRFWILPVKQRIPYELLAANRDQLWAEAVCAAEAGETWWLESDQESKREEENAEFTEEDSWADKIGQWLEDHQTKTVTIGEVLELGLKIEVGRHGRWEQMRAARVLTQLKWKRKQLSSQGTRKWHYVRGDQLVD